MTSEEISKMPVGEILGKKAVYHSLYPGKIRRSEIIKIQNNRLVVKRPNQVLENIPWTSVQSIE